MALEIVIPEANVKDRTTKDLVFSLLIENTSKTLTQLHREIKKKYGVSVTFQAVIKAVNSLISHDVLIKEEKIYSINPDWIFETRNFFDNLYRHHFNVKKPMKKIELGKEITVYTVSNLLELDRLWFDLLMNWSKKEKNIKINCWMGRHAWWLLPRLQEEDLLHDFMIKKGVKTYNLWTSNTALDKIAVNYYKNKGMNSIIRTKIKLIEEEHIASFGDNIIKFKLPKELGEKLDKLYQNTKKLDNLNIKKTIDIFKENHEIEFTLIKDKFIAEKVREDIITSFK